MENIEKKRGEGGKQLWVDFIKRRGYEPSVNYAHFGLALFQELKNLLPYLPISDGGKAGVASRQMTNMIKP